MHFKQDVIAPGMTHVYPAYAEDDCRPAPLWCVINREPSLIYSLSNGRKTTIPVSP